MRRGRTNSSLLGERRRGRGGRRKGRSLGR